MPIDSMVYGYIASEEDYPDKKVLIEEGAKGDWIYILLKGEAKVKKNTPKGKITIDSLKEGAIFGEMTLFFKENAVRTATIVANGPVKVGILDKERLDREFESLSPQLKGLIRVLISRLKSTTNKASLMAIE